MQCTEIREHLFDLMAGETVTPEVKAHFSACPACASELASMNKTMALLDEWKAPEDTSPYFMTRLRARVREEAATEVSTGWLTWFRKPVFAISMAILFLVSISLINSGDSGAPAVHQAPKSVTVSATNDLQYLDKNSDVLQNLELLDDLDTGQRANP
jgi:anti-sigma factor RsiW